MKNPTKVQDSPYDSLISNDLGVRFLKPNMPCDKTLEVRIQGLEDVKYTCNDTIFHWTTEYFRNILKIYFKKFKKEYRFHKPQLVYTTVSNAFILRLKMLKKLSTPKKAYKKTAVKTLKN